MEALPVMLPALPAVDAVARYLRAMDASRIYSNFGPLVTELERRYAERFNVPPEAVVACANATLGLQGAAALSPAGTFHCPSWTFPATPLSIVTSAKRLVLHDVDADSWQLDLAPLSDDDGIMPVLPFGAEVDVKRWAHWSEVVVDAAASGGSRRRDLADLPAGWAVVLSLHATKVLGIGEGGIVIFGDLDRADRLRSYISLGFAWRRESDFVGTNAKMSEMAAAYGLAALDGWAQEEAEWRAARDLVGEAELALGLSSVCAAYPGVNPYWIVQFPIPELALAAVAALDDARIGNRRWWPVPCSRMGAFVEVWGDLPVPQSDWLSATTLGLPFFRGLRATDVERVVSTIAAVPR
jgi:dTDP-4-amino-4,6-dideoxygalactose transaminase